MAMKKKVIKHLKGDIKSFHKEAADDKKLIKSLKHEKHEEMKHEKKEHAKHEKHEKKEHKKKHEKHKAKGEGKISKVMTEFKEHELHSGCKKGPVVTNPKQGIAIALSEAKKVGAKIKKK